MSDTITPFEAAQRSLNRSFLENDTLLSNAFWEELRIFLAVAKAKSFNKASEILNMSQPRVSRRVKRLQDMMGAQLFISTQRGVQLTARGKEVAEACARLDQFLYSLRNDLQSEQSQEAAIVRVSVTDGLAAIFLAPALLEFNARHPRIQVHIKSPENLISLRENATDMMVGFAHVAPSDVTLRTAGFLHFLPFASRGYIDLYGVPTRQNAHEHAFVQSEFYAARTGVWDSWLDLIANGRIAHYCDNMFTYGAVAKAGVGIALLANYNAIEPAAVPLDLDVRIRIPMSIAAMTERLQSKPVRLVFEWLAEVFGRDNPWFGEKMVLRSQCENADAGFRQLFNV
ncbi:LysR family transcriptional regulator [Consotaella salsifontis]|uniref:DNA-binding transcriptional regulator, LysR family n=1 Tax=Consotaella salsifontis TaxID=1365950 RepID=A0A1T4P8C1_9HYPH|nr:LysR family transcriptional regulator [Consotaella salsifontis]SJZ87754.1 DNA-binding transcriptional regulator, LysR family [Consotaella salsifontis]